MSALEVVAVVTAAAGVWLTTRRTVIAWPITLVSCVLYGVVFREARLYSDMLLQGVFAVFCVYGWWQWSKGVREEGTVTVWPAPRRTVAAGIVCGVAGGLLLGALMRRYTNAALPFVDASLTSFSLVATAWGARKYIANWTVWIVVDVVYTGMFVFKHLYLTAGLYAVFVGLAVWGLREWRRASMLRA